MLVYQYSDSGPESISSGSSYFADELEGDTMCGSGTSACDGDIDSGTVLSDGSDIQPASPSADNSYAIAVDTTNGINLTDDNIGLAQNLTEVSDSEDNSHSPNPIENNVHLIGSVTQLQERSTAQDERPTAQDERPTDSGNASVDDTSVNDDYEDIHPLESAPNESEGDTVSENLDTLYSNTQGSAAESENDSCSCDDRCCVHSYNSDCGLHSMTCEDSNYDKNASGTSSDTDSASCCCDEHKSKQTDSDSCVENVEENSLPSESYDGSMTELESDLSSHDECDGSCNCNENVRNDSDCEESDSRMIKSEDSSCSFNKCQSQETDSDSDSGNSCSVGDKSDENDSDGSVMEPESDSYSESSDNECGSQQTGSDSESHSCAENVHGSDCDKSDETNSNDEITGSDSDSCSESCSSCCCSCEECCNRESASDEYYDSESDSSSGEDTTDSDYDGDDEDDDESLPKSSKCQLLSGISSQLYSNKTVRLIRVRNVGLVVMAVTKVSQGSEGRRDSVEASSSLQMLKRLGKEISFKRLPC